MDTTPKQENDMSTKTSKDKKAIFIKWLRRVGVWGFLFFLVKGLIWLALGYWVFT